MSTIILTSDQFMQVATACTIAGIALGDNFLKTELQEMLRLVKTNPKLKSIEDLALKLLIEKLVTEDSKKLFEIFTENPEKLKIPLDMEDLKSFSREVIPDTFEVNPDFDFVKTWLERE